jgi:hypothetical protein
MYVGTTGISGNQANAEVSIFPNPFSEELVFRSSKTEQLELTIRDFTGRTLIRKSLNRTTPVRTATLSAGIYLYEIRNRSGVIQTGKLVKDRN